jgi:hypothetical protein
MKVAPQPVTVTVVAPATDGVRSDRRQREGRLGLFAKIAYLRARWFGLGAAGSRQRSRAGVSCYIGLNGSGKTMHMVADVAAELDGVPWHCEQEDHAHTDPQYGPDGSYLGPGPAAVFDGFVRVLSTVRLLDDLTGQLHPRYEKFDDWRQLEGLEHAVLLLDEITGVAHSRDAGGLPHNIMNMLMQMRKGDVRVMWSAPAWARADKLVREVTGAVTVCFGSHPVRGTGQLWAQNRFFRSKTYAMEDFDEWTSGRQDKLTPLVSDYIWGPTSRAFRLYNTKQKVTRIGHASDSGVCVECGGTRRRQECSCHDYQGAKQARKEKVASLPMPSLVASAV